MKIADINKLFGRFGQFQIRHRIFFLIVITVITIICTAGLKKLKLSSSEEDWFADWEETKINEDHFKELFDSYDNLAILVQADNVFDKEVLEAIQKLGDRLEQDVPYAKDITSLTTISLPLADGEDSINIVKPFEDGIPDDENEIKEKQDFIMSRDSLVNNIVSDDCKETWVLLSFYAYTESLDEAKDKIAPPAMEIINSPEFQSEKYTLKPIGFSYTEYEEDLAMEKEASSKVILGFIVMIICLIVFIRSIRGLIVPLFATVFALTSVLGASAWLNIEGSTILIVLPILLSMALSVGYSIHYINSFRMHFRRTGKRKDSVIKAVEESGWPILFTVITTMASMFSFLFSGINSIKWVGACTASCVFAVFCYVIILIPILMSFGKDKNYDLINKNDNNGATKADLAFESAGKKILDRRLITVIISSIIAITVIPLFTKIKVNMDYVEMMGSKIPYVSRILEIMDAKIGSQYDYNIMIEFPNENDVKTPETFKKIDQLSDEVGKLKMTKVSGNKARVTSITSIVKEVNRMMNADKSEYYSIPDDSRKLSAFLLFYEISNGEELYKWVDEAFKTTYIHVALKGYDAEKMVDDVAEVKKLCAEIFPEAKCSIVGEVINFAAMNGKLVRAELKSFAFSFLIILILMAVAFTSIRTGLIAMIPNLAPVFLIGAIMGAMQYSLDMMTMTIMPMILGIAVDDTIHFINHIKYYFEKTGNYSKSILASYREIGKTMVTTTIILCSMFLVLAFSSVACISRIGMLSVVGLATAVVADYTLTPVLMFITKPFGKESAK
ncbi:MAG: MMPL family transporter [Treponema sp.]|nr:MMPL family transporter [Treponema sp.]